MSIKSNKWILMSTLMAAVAISSCSKENGGSDAGSSSTLSISGSLSTCASSSALGMYAVSPYSSSCADGNFYEVYCVTFSANPTAATGSVACSGASGSYTVSGIPKNVAFGCFVRSSTDGSSFKTVGSIEIPASGSLGDTDQITASGDMGINISIGSNGSVTATVTSDNRVTIDTASNATDAATFNGIYSLACDNTSGGSLYSQAACKCFLGENQYGSNYNNHDECMADSAGAGSKITGPVSMYVDFNIYDATANADISEDGKVIIKAGDRVQGVTVWGASDSSTSYRGGASDGEGLAAFASVMGLTWSNISGFKSQAEANINWTTSVDITSGGSATTVPAGFLSLLSSWNATSPKKTVGDWMTGIQAFVDAAETASDFSCGSYWMESDPGAGNGESNAGCLQRFFDQMPESATLPRIHVQPYCDHTGCKADVAKARIWVEGVDFSYNHDSWSGSQAAVETDLTKSQGPNPRTRYVFEQWHPLSGGGGGFKQRNENHRWYSCDDASGADVQHSSCSGSSNHDGLECFMEEELAIRFLPVSTGLYNVIFESRNVVYGGQFHLENNSSGPVFSAAATDLCKTKNFSDSAFMATGTKQ
ncbi:MAG: hypothetical protein KDD35_06500 [Bdellovibrionales bacterium]|nr:hypothetical protein [Bdellovibrionales bacterium]